MEKILNEIKDREKKFILSIIIFGLGSSIIMILGLTISNLNHYQAISDITLYICVGMVCIMMIIMSYEVKKRDELLKRPELKGIFSD
jgi:hypothetical protein